MTTLPAKTRLATIVHAPRIPVTPSSEGCALPAALHRDPASQGERHDPGAKHQPPERAGPRPSTPRSSTGELNQTGRVLLGMIAEGHGTGCADTKPRIGRSTRLFWGASVGGLYPELRRLTVAGLGSVRDDPRGESRRYSYTITAAGRQALTTYLAHRPIRTGPRDAQRGTAADCDSPACSLPAERLTLVHRMRDVCATATSSGSSSSRPKSRPANSTTSSIRATDRVRPRI